MNPSSSSSSSGRLPSFRDISDIQKVVLPFNKNKILNKKTYVPNLALSRNIHSRIKLEEKTAEVKKEPPAKETRRTKLERKIIIAAETFVPQSEINRSIGLLSVQSKSKVINASSSLNLEDVNQLFVRESLSEQLDGKFEGLKAALPQDLPVSISQSRLVKSERKPKVLIKNILNPDGGESPLFLLKTPKYIPAVLDESKNHPKIPTTANGKDGYKCTIHDLPDGQIGKLQVLKSGKLRLILGDCKFWLHQGVKVNFKEELAVVKTDKESRTGEIISLGNVQGRIIVVPEAITKLNLDT